VTLENVSFRAPEPEEIVIGGENAEGDNQGQGQGLDENEGKEEEKSKNAPNEEKVQENAEEVQNMATEPNVAVSEQE
jgi:hypothetical protein